MMHLLKRLLLFSVPFWLYGLLIYLTDPFNLLQGPALVSNEIKLRTAYPLNACLWKMPKFARHPSANLLLGDSRMDAVDPARLKQLTGADYFNLAYGGGTMREIVESFWFASERTRLRRVYIGVNFSQYTDYAQYDRTAEVLTIQRCTACYFINRTVLRAALYSVAAKWMHYNPRIGVVDEDRETFWREQVGPKTDDFLARHVYPRRFHADLENIVRYAKDNGIELVFVIFPTHVESQNRVRDFHMEGEYARFKQDLSALATTYDYDYPNEMTADKNNFADPYHSRNKIVDEIMREVWSGQFRLGRPLTTTASPVKFSSR